MHPLAEEVLAQLREEFGAEVFLAGGEECAFAVFPARHPEVGALSLVDNGSDVVVLVGRFTHVHFGEESGADPAAIARRVVSFLHDVFSDRVEFFGSRRGGGLRRRDGRRRGFLSRLVFGSRTYVWSGPTDAA